MSDIKEQDKPFQNPPATQEQNQTELRVPPRRSDSKFQKIISSNHFKIILTVVLMLFLFLTAFLIAVVSELRNQRPKQFGRSVPPAEVIIPTPETTPVPTIEIDEIVLETYSNEEFGFEFRYPKFWRFKTWNIFGNTSELIDENKGLLSYIIKDVFATISFIDYSPLPNESSSKSVFGFWLQNPNLDFSSKKESRSSESPIDYQYSSYNSAPLGIFVNVWDNKDGETLDQLSEGYGKYQETSKVQVAGLPALSVKEQCVFGDEELCPVLVWGHEAIIFVNEDKIYTVFFAGDDYKTDFNKILSTLRLHSGQ